MDREHIVASGASADELELSTLHGDLFRRVRDLHPRATVLAKLPEMQAKVYQQTPDLWVDEDAGVLLYLRRERVKPAGVALTLYRYGLLSPQCSEVLASLAERLLKRLDNPKDYSSWRGAGTAMGALEDLFTIQLARLRLAHGDPAGVDRAIRDQIGRARSTNETARRTAFRSWHVQELTESFGTPKAAQAADALGYAPADLADWIGAWAAYRQAPFKELRSRNTASGGRRRDRQRFRSYYEFRTVGRRLTEEQMATLKGWMGHAVVEPERLVADLRMSSDDDLPWDPGKVFADYFDAALHFKQAGGRRLWLRVPSGDADLTAAAHQLSGRIDVERVGGDLLIEIDHAEFDGEGAYVDADPTGWLSALLPLREALAEGDFRALHMAWHSSMEELYYGSDRPADPPVPPGTGVLAHTPELEALDHFLTWVP